jgi:hypothetical protein
VEGICVTVRAWDGGNDERRLCSIRGSVVLKNDGDTQQMKGREDRECINILRVWLHDDDPGGGSAS